MALVLTALCLVLLCGCGEVVVFGHTVHEAKHSSEAGSTPGESSDLPAPQPVAPVDSPHPVATSQAQPRDKEPVKPATMAALRKVSLMPVLLAPQAAAQIKDDSKFNIEALHAAIQAELRSRKVLEETASPLAVSEITIDEYDLHPVSNVILFGKTYHAGAINGVLRIRDTDGNELSQQRIEASAKISIADEGEPTDSLQPLYREFARQIGNTLTGTQVQSAIRTGSGHAQKD